MKRKIFSTLFALVLVTGLSLMPAVPAAASHTSSATVAFHAGASQLVGEASALDVVVTSDGGSLGKINQVNIDFSGTDFTSIGKGVEPTNWTGVVDGLVITYTAAPGVEIDAGASLTFYPTVINPGTTGTATNPTVATSDPGTKATLTTGTGGTDEISYVADDVGADGNAITVAYVNTASSATLDVSVSGTDITVTLADDGVNPTSTADEVIAAINADDDALALVDASTTDAGVVVAAAAANLAGGSDADVDEDCPVTGILTIKEFVVTAVPAAFSSATETNYTISFTTLTEIVAATGTIIITFPSGYDISLLEEVDISVDVGGVYTPSAIDINATARTVTLTADGAIAVSDDVVVATANDHVKNPPDSGTYDIAVLTSGTDSGSGEATIIPAAFNVVAGTSNTVTAGTAFAVTVTALNEDEDTDTGYAGSYFIDFDAGAATGTIPTFELISFTAGVGTSPANFILTVATETPTISAEDATTGITGTSAAITINPAVLASLTITGTLPSPAVAGVAFATPGNDITVTAEYAAGKVKTDYVGTVTWTSTDASAVLPADYTFTSEDEGVAVFLGSEFTLKTVGGGTQTVTVTDGLVSATSGAITVEAASATAIEVVASPGVVIADGTDSSAITANALDEFGNVADYDIGGLIESSLGSMSGTTGFTDGVATATLTSIADEVGTAIIKVTSGTLPYATTTVKLLADIAIDSIDVTVDKTTILNNGVDVRTITATYLDTGSAVVTAADGADYKVTFSITTGEGTLSETEVDPVAGVATTTLTTTLASGTIVVTATGIGALTDTSPTITVEEGTHAITLYQSWNLISLPLIPTDDSIETVLAELITAGTVIQVRAYSDGTWSIWASTGPYAENPTLTEMEDGSGFWVEMSAGDTLTATGCVIPAPPETPPTYSVYTGWNMIGFTSLDTTTDASVYLGTAVTLTLEAMYGYDAATGLYEVVLTTTDLVPGQGYWLAVNANGTIYP